METALGLAFWGFIWVGLPWLAFLVLRAIWRSFSAPTVARKAGEVATKLEDAYRDGRGR